MGAAEGWPGSLLLTSSTGDVAVTARLVAVEPTGQGSIGTAIPVVTTDTGLQEGSRHVFSMVSDAGDRSVRRAVPGTYRTALGLVESSGQPVNVGVRIRSVAGAPVAALGGVRHYRLGGFQAVLLDEVAKELLGSVRSGLGDLQEIEIEVTVTEGPGRIVPFVLSLDNGSGDAIMRME